MTASFGKIRIRNINDMKCIESSSNILSVEVQSSKKNKPKIRAATTSKKPKLKKQSSKSTSNQLPIDSFFKTATKTYTVPSPNSLAVSKKPKTRCLRGRKRLFDESIISNVIEIIDLCDDDDDDEIEHKPKEEIKKNSEEKTIPTPDPIQSDPQPQSSNKQRKHRPCPPYKIVEDTSFAVDGFQYGDIPNVTHYFLTHYHADHYVGLNRKFAHPLYLSPITAGLVRTFIPIDEQFIHEIEVDQPIVVNDVEITAIDANHCPGAIMLYFKFPCGKCILHTGDFRASCDMESLPIFWNNLDLDVLYLDTTYLTAKYDFCHQSESIDRVIKLVRDFREKFANKRVLYVCGTYVIGKEKIWMALANEFDLKVWTEPVRRKAINSLQLPDLDLRLFGDAHDANFHIIGMQNVSYPRLVEYFEEFSTEYDMLLAIRPSGWEKNSKPSYGKIISVIGIEYSEHSSYKELERFVRFLKPKKVISTVPVARDLFITGDVPKNWYQYDGCGSLISKGYQPSITTYFKTPKSQYRKRRQLQLQSKMSISPLEEVNTNIPPTSVHKEEATNLSCSLLLKKPKSHIDCLDNN